MAKFKVSKYGQWEYPGQPTAVPTEDGRITMQGVPYPVFAMDETGYGGMIYPGGNYQFPGKMVYEIPMAYGGDISIPDLSRPNWLDKAQKGLQYTGEPTRADSLELLNTSRMVLDYYNSKNYIADPPQYLKDAPKKDSFMDETMSAHKMYDPTVKQLTLTGLRPVPLNEYYQPVDNNKFYQRELAYGILDTNSPMVLYDRRIQPTTIRQYGNNDLSSPIAGDIAVMGMYDPLSITPWDMLTDAEKKLRVKRFGRDGVPDDYAPDRPPVPKNILYRNVQLLQQPEDRLVREYTTQEINPEYRRVYDKSPYSTKEYGPEGKPTHWAKEDENISGIWRPVKGTPSDLIVSKKVKMKSGGWLDKYQDGSQVAANLPWINQQGQYKDPNGVGPTVQKDRAIKERKMIEELKASYLPPGSITPAMGPVERLLMPSFAAEMFSSQMQPKVGPTEIPPHLIGYSSPYYGNFRNPTPNKFLPTGKQKSWTTDMMKPGRTSKINIMDELPGKKKYGGWLDNY
jgi:hypothetical protein